MFSVNLKNTVDSTSRFDTVICSLQHARSLPFFPLGFVYILTSQYDNNLPVYFYTILLEFSEFQVH